MKRGQRLTIGVISIFVLLTIGITFLEDPTKSGFTTLTGFAIYSDSCGGIINTEGYWELNSSIDCSTGNGITINVSNVQLDCHNYNINGTYENSSIGLTISANLTNTTLENCNILAFYDPITINSGSNLSIQNTYVEANNSCITGTWTDSGNNTGCLDTTGPTIIATNQTIYSNESLSYTPNASDPSGIANYSLTFTNQNTSLNTTVNFTINTTSGLITNSSGLVVSNHTLTITVTDALNYQSQTAINVEVQTPPVSGGSGSGSGGGGGSGSDDDDDEDSTSSSSSSSEATRDCPESKAWKCVEWECKDDGFERRYCTKQDITCNTPLPVTKRPCTEDEDEDEEETCTPAWECTWEKCIEGKKKAISCTDANECGEEAPTEEICTSEEIEAQRVALTGSVIGKLGEVINKRNIPSIAAIIILIVGFALTIVLGKPKNKIAIANAFRRLKKKTAVKPAVAVPATPLARTEEKREIKKEPEQPKAQPKTEEPKEDDHKKLWDWEEKHQKKQKESKESPREDDSKKLWDWENRN